MKNKKFLACLLACLCCFQSGACIPAIAEDSAQEATEATENLSEIAQVCRQLQEEFNLTSITYDENENSIQIAGKNEIWLNYVKNACKEKGLFRKYNISFYQISNDGELFPEPTAKDYQEMDNDIKKIKEFISTNITEEYEEMPQTLIASNDWFKTIRLEASTQENADKLKAFCEESGLAEKYKISYDVIYQTDYSVIPELNQAVSQILQFAREKKMSPPEDLLNVAYWDNQYDSKRHVIGFCINVFTETQEELDTIKAYCEEQGFTDEYEFVFQVYQESETEIETDFTAGDVTLDGSVDILDVITVNKAILGKETLTAMQNKTADINRDDKIDSSDALEILKQIVGIAE